MEEKGGDMGGSGGKWGEMGGNGESSTKQYGKCRNNFKSGRKLGENGTKYLFLTVPFPPFFWRPKIFPTVPFELTALTNGKMGISATH